MTSEHLEIFLFILEDFDKPSLAKTLLVNIVFLHDERIEVKLFSEEYFFPLITAEVQDSKKYDSP